MERLVLVALLAVAAVAVAYVLQQRRPKAAPTPTGYNVPDHLDRTDFDQPDAPWLVAVFTSVTCDTCAGVWQKTQLLGSDDVATQEVEVSARSDLHKRYAIEAVPSTLIVDADGHVRASFLGAVTATDLWATVAELREPGTLSPDGCNHGLD